MKNSENYKNAKKKKKVSLTLEMQLKQNKFQLFCKVRGTMTAHFNHSNNTDNNLISAIIAYAPPRNFVKEFFD